MLSIESTTRFVEIVAVIRPGAVPKTVQALAHIEQPAFTRWRALGRGRQCGIRMADEEGSSSSIDWLSKIVLNIVVPEDRAQAVIEAVIQANQTGAVGDGRIFVCPMDEEVSVRTGERSAAAVEG